MSRRTSEANKAISTAWTNEQQLVREGKGTRDWTPEQQQDILDRGKVYDDNGKAFEGHHMKSAEKFPEYQGNSQNIQFISRSEHFNAHNGNFQNPTNGFYNYRTGDTLEFKTDVVVPCNVIDLTESIIKPQMVHEVKKEVVNEPIKEAPKIKVQKTTQEKTENAPPLTHNSIAQKQNSGLGQKFKSVVKNISEFSVKHPTAVKVIKGVGTFVTLVVAYVVTESVTRDGSSKSDTEQSDDYPKNEDVTYDYNDSYEESYDPSDETYSIDDDSSESVERSSPEEHMVKSHGQHYHTKVGLIWKEKEPFPRGGKKDE